MGFGVWLSRNRQSKVSHCLFSHIEYVLNLLRYVHANYRFVVDPQGDYRAQAVDADVHLDWNNILQILVSTQSQLPNCPICLSTPVAPRMGKCGHVFCLPCLIRYMHSTDDTSPLPDKRARWKKCPICWDSVYISETRPVRLFSGQEGDAPKEGGDVMLRLLTRKPGSTLALPRDGAESLEKVEDIPWYFAAEVMDYARVMKGTEDYMNAQYDGEVEGLQRQEKEDELMFGEETQWTRKAVATILDAKEKVKGIGNSPNAPRQTTEQKHQRRALPNPAQEGNAPELYNIQHAAKSGQSISRQPTTLSNEALVASTSESVMNTDTTSNIVSTTNITTTILEPSRKPSAIAEPRQGLREKVEAQSHVAQIDLPYFFYEALLHYYLSPLDIRILKVAFGEFALFPSTILPRVERVSTGHIIDDELRKRAKYLAHLPHGCEVAFLECDWTDVVAPGILDRFSTEIDRRRKKNMEKSVREEKDRIKAEKEEDDKRWAAARRRRPAAIPETITDADFQPLAQHDGGFEGTAESSSLNTSSPPWASSRNQVGSAFASLASPSTSPVAPRTVWGTTAIPPASPSLLAVSEPEPSENDGWLQGWEQDLLHHDDELAAQMAVSSMDQGVPRPTLTGSQAKKKKGKKITLMTTNARRGA